MATYPSIMSASGSVKQSRINKVYSTSAIKQTRQIKGPNMFKRMIRGLVTWSMGDNHQHQEAIAVPDDACRLSATGIRFEVYRANGGTVVETRRNDRRTGDSVYELHVISGDQDLGAEIGKIITLEALKS